MPNIRIYGPPTTSKLGLDLETALRGLEKPECWHDRVISPTTIDCRPSNTLRLDVIFVNRDDLAVRDLIELEEAVITTARAFLRENSASHGFTQIVIRMIPTPSHLYHVIEL